MLTGPRHLPVSAILIGTVTLCPGGTESYVEGYARLASKISSL